MARVTVTHVRRAWDIGLPGEDCMNNPGKVQDGWLELDCFYTDSRGNKKLKNIYGPASRKAIAEAYQIRIRWAQRNPISRHEKICWILYCLGGDATSEDAEAVLDALEAKGYAVVKDRRGLGIQIIPPIGFDKFWGIVDTALGAGET